MSKKKISITRQGIITPEVIKKIVGINIEISGDLKKKHAPDKWRRGSLPFSGHSCEHIAAVSTPEE